MKFVYQRLSKCLLRTEEIFTISQVLDTNPVQYKVQDYRGDEIQGSFYGAELQKVVKPALYSVEKVIRTRRVRGRTQYLVKWLGYRPEHNSWVDDMEALGFGINILDRLLIVI